MTRAGLLLLVAALLSVLAALLVEVSSDADAVLAPETLALDALDTAAGRSVVIALESPDRDARDEAARAIAGLLADDPLVASVNAGPAAPSEAFLDWLWEKRFRLAPPEPRDLTVAALTQRLAEARASLSGAEGFLFGDRLLRDPTGSFACLLQRFSDRGGGGHGLAHEDGHWRSRDGRAVLLFVTLADRPFETAEVAALSQRIRERASGVTVQLLGTRLVSAEISRVTARESTRAALLAGALLLAWLAWVLRSARGLALAVLPLACGLAAACLAVQLLFGSVHVIALGFGGVLAGLALDYPLHLLSHPGTARPGAERLVLLGALTTAVGFLATLGSGVPALMQTGVFVAVGLAVAAAASRATPTEGLGSLRSPPVERLAWRLPFRAPAEVLLLLAGAAVLAAVPADRPDRLFEPPERVRQATAEIARMVDLPSGRHAVLVEAGDLDELLARETALEAVLETAVAAGWIEDYALLAQHLPARATPAELPDAAAFRQRAERALRANGMAAEFAATQAADYERALQAPAPSRGDLASFPELRPLATQVEETADGLHEVVRLFGVGDPAALAEAVAARDLPGVRAIDLAAPLEAAMRELRRQVILWLGLGLLAAVLVLALAHGDWRRALAIGRTTGAAVGLAALLLTLAGGPLGVFQIVALTLLFGIGVDYGLFLARPGAGAHRADFRSVGLCAVSTLAGFSMMALSSVKLLHDIGTTVILGVLLVLAFHLGGAARAETER